MPRWLLVISALLLGWGSEAVAQTWPSKPIRAIVAFAAGSATDIIPRVVFEPLSAQLGQPIVVENRGGAGGSIGTAMVAKADPDGYSILIQASAHSAAPAAYPNISYDPARDFSVSRAHGSSESVASQFDGTPIRFDSTFSAFVAPVVEKRGLEPPTSCLQSRRSTS